MSRDGCLLACMQYEVSFCLNGGLLAADQLSMFMERKGA